MFGFFRRKEMQNIDKRGGLQRGEYDSKRWHLVCSECGNKKSYYELGGVRAWAAGTGKSKRLLCTSCGVKQRFRTEWIEVDDPRDGKEG